MYFFFLKYKLWKYFSLTKSKFELRVLDYITKYHRKNNVKKLINQDNETNFMK